MTSKAALKAAAESSAAAATNYANLREKRSQARQDVVDAEVAVSELETRIRQGDLTVNPSDLTDAEGKRRHADLYKQSHDVAASKAAAEYAAAEYVHLEHLRAVDTDAAGSILDEAIPAATEHLAKAFAAIAKARAGHAAHASAVSSLASQHPHATLPATNASSRPTGSPNWQDVYLDDLVVAIYNAAIREAGLSRQGVEPYQSSLVHVNGLSLLSPRLTKPVPAVALAVAANDKKGA